MNGRRASRETRRKKQNNAPLFHVVLLTHLNLANGEGEAAVAVVILDNLKLVLLPDVEHGRRL